MSFVGRQTEMASLEREFNSNSPSLVVVYGRRRIGKSTLLQEAASRHGPHIYFQAERLQDGLSLESFKNAVRDALHSDEDLDAASDWGSILRWLARAAEATPKLVVILDEFPNLYDDEKSLPSVIQKFWDSGRMRAGNMKLVLCGSTISQMEGLLAERNPLFGRRTMQLDVRPMPLRDAGLLMPEWSSVDKIACYAILGGIPKYLEALDPKSSLHENIVKIMMSPNGILYEEPKYLLQSETNETRRYASVIEAVAGGATKLSEIISKAGMQGGDHVSPYLERLIRMRILERTKSFGAPPKARENRYFVADPLFRFHSRYVIPNSSAISRNFGKEVFNRFVRPDLPQFMGLAFEDICREHVRLFAQERMGAPAHEIGKIWSGTYDIDVAGKLLDGSWVIGECKWDGSGTGESILRKLSEVAEDATNHAPASTHFVMFSRSGFTPGLVARAKTDASIVLYEPDELIDWPDGLDLDLTTNPTP